MIIFLSIFLFMEFIEDYDKTQNKVSLKIVLLGKDDTGKTKFVERLIAFNDHFKFNKSKEYNPTVCGAYSTNIVKFNNKTFKLEIWDTAGQEIFKNLVRIFYKESDVILLFYNSFNKQSFETIKEFYNDCILRNINKNCKYIVIRDKYDLKLENKEYVSDEEVLEFADKNNLLFTHISSYEKYETGIDNLIYLILNEFCKYN